MAAPTTIHDLPDDMLHEIFERVFADEPKEHGTLVSHALLPPEGAHAALRCVCRRWSDIADWARLSTSKILVHTPALADAGAVRARHPAAFKRIVLTDSMDAHSTTLSRAAPSLVNGSADLRRSLSFLQLQACCLQSLVPAVAPIASCSALTDLSLYWGAHERERVVPSNMLAPLSALRMLHRIAYVQMQVPRGRQPKSALLAPLPALPDAPRLTSLLIGTTGNFVPVGSDAALGRLRRLDLWHAEPVQELVDADDPFLLRTAFDAGTWQPSRLTGLQQLECAFEPVRDSRAPLRPLRTGSRAGSEWAPLADQVTSLIVSVDSDGYKRPSTGIVAGLGALTALRKLIVHSDIISKRLDLLEPVFLDRVHAPHLTTVSVCVATPANVARFPSLVHLFLGSTSNQPPLNLRSLAARSTLKTLLLVNENLLLPSLINLAELFVGGGGWPVLEELWLRNISLEWDTTGLAGAPSAAEFAERARQLLPALVKVRIVEPSGRNALPDRSRVGCVLACRRHVVPALLGLRGGGK